MPFIEVKTNKELTELEVLNIKKEVENNIFLINKTPNWLMVNVKFEHNLRFNLSDESCCMVEVKTYGKVNYENANKFSSAITSYISTSLNIKRDRIYLAYFDTNTWSFDGENF